MVTRDAEATAPRRPPDTAVRPRAARRAVERVLWWLPAVVIFGGTFLFRFLSLELVNDHFRILTQARQIILAGEMPFRDFVDPGIFLQIYASAAAQLLFGYSLLGEALLSVLFLSLGAALTFALARQASGSTIVGFILAVFVVALYPRLYQYHLTFLPVLGLAVCWWYVDRMTTRRLVALGLVTALAFLVRHDQGLYIGLAAVVTLVSAHWGDGFRAVLRCLALYGIAAAVSVLPFFLFLERSGGIAEYVRTAVEYARSEVRRQQLVWPSFVVDQSVPLLSIAAPPPGMAPIAIRLAAGVNAEARAEPERRDHLRESEAFGDDGRGRSLRYTLLDGSTGSVSALVKDPRVEDTDGADPSTGRLTEASEPPFTAWRRAIPLLWLSVAPGIVQPVNATPWLYYLFVSLPLIAALVLIVRRLRSRRAVGDGPLETPKILGAVVLCAVAQQALLRDPLSYRLADAAAPTALLGAWLLGRWLGPRLAPRFHPPQSLLMLRPSPGRIRRLAASVVPPTLRLVAAGALLGITWASIASVAEVDKRLDETDLLDGPPAVQDRAVSVLRKLRASPPLDAWAPPGSTEVRGLVRYVHDCTRPTDRLLVTAFQPELYFYSGRLFAGDQIFFFSSFRSSRPDQERTLARLHAQSVPIVLTDAGEYRVNIQRGFRLIHEYLAANYRVAHEAGSGGTETKYQVLVDRRLAPTGTYGPLALPCFR